MLPYALCIRHHCALVDNHILQGRKGEPTIPDGFCPLADRQGMRVEGWVGFAFRPPPARKTARSRSCPHEPELGALARATDIRRAKSVKGATPVTAWRYVSAAPPPVCKNRFGHTPTAASLRNLHARLLTAARRCPMTFAFPRRPTHKAAPRQETLPQYWIPKSCSSLPNQSLKQLVEAVQKDFVHEMFNKKTL